MNRKYQQIQEISEEKRKYEVDDTFPKITKASFKDDHIPESITQITYTIDLDGLEYTVW